MAKFTCEQCGGTFVRDRSGSRPIRFCNGVCYQAFRRDTGYNKSGTFAPGSRPWNKDVKGLHLSPASEFKKGRVSARVVSVGTITTRTDKNGAPRLHRKVADPNVWVLNAVFVYEAAFGPVPAGKVVHHVDFDSLHDDPGNLVALTRAEHIEVHRAALLAAKKQGICSKTRAQEAAHG